MSYIYIYIQREREREREDRVWLQTSQLTTTHYVATNKIIHMYFSHITYLISPVTSLNNTCRWSYKLPRSMLQQTGDKLVCNQTLSIYIIHYTCSVILSRRSSFQPIGIQKYIYTHYTCNVILFRRSSIQPIFVKISRLKSSNLKT